MKYDGVSVIIGRRTCIQKISKIKKEIVEKFIVHILYPSGYENRLQYRGKGYVSEDGQIFRDKYLLNYRNFTAREEMIYNFRTDIVVGILPKRYFYSNNISK